jgi:regulator of RNase E activity RraA
VVVDGNVRDVVDLRRSGVPVYSKGVTPRGPVWGGRFGLPIECGGVVVTAGDLIVGDEDGVIAVPLAEVTAELRARCEARRDREAAQPG